MTRRARIAGLLAALALGPGCVLRTLQVRSAPSGARVYLDDRPIGVTPLDHPFDFYGTRRLRIVKDGHVPHEADVRLWAPWYEWFPLDVVSELLWPGVIHDRHTYVAPLEPYATGDAARAEAAALLTRAEAARAAGALPR